MIVKMMSDADSKTKTTRMMVLISVTCMPARFQI